MRFGDELDQTLRSGEFPESWTQAAISYTPLKECIDKVQAELADLGLDTPIISELITPVAANDESTTDNGPAASEGSAASDDFAASDDSPASNKSASPSWLKSRIQYGIIGEDHHGRRGYGHG